MSEIVQIEDDVLGVIECTIEEKTAEGKTLKLKVKVKKCTNKELRNCRIKRMIVKLKKY